MWRQRSIAWWMGIMLVALAAGLYLGTLADGLSPDELVGGDLITHHYAQVQGRPGNAPGYPLYTMGGWLWFRLGTFLLGGVLNPIQILSAYSALWSLASLWLLYRLLLKAAGGRWSLAFGLAAFYAVSYFFWYYSVTSEQYTSAIFQTLLVTWLAFRWFETEHDRYLPGISFAAGTMLANMVTTLLIIPPLLVVVLVRRPMLLRRPVLLAQAVGLSLAPLVSYAYVYIRGAQYPEWRGHGEWPSAWAWFIDFLSTQQGRDELAEGLTLAHVVTDEFPALMWGELGWIALIGGVLGLALLGKSRALWLYLTLALYLAFCWVDRFGNWYQVILPAYPLFLLGFGRGLAWLLDQAGARRPWVAHTASGAVALLLLGMVTWRFTLSLPEANQRQRPDDTGLASGWAILADGPPEDAAVAAKHAELLALEYLNIIWGVRPVLESRPDLPADFITRELAAMYGEELAEHHPQAYGLTLIALPGAPRYEPPLDKEQAAQEVGEGLTLLGYRLYRPAIALPDGALPPRWGLTLYWRSEKELAAAYTASVRPMVGGAPLAGPEGKALLQDHQPVWNTFPTDRWQPGEVVADSFSFIVPEAIEPDAVQVVVYRPTETGFENLGELTLHFGEDQPPD